MSSFKIGLEEIGDGCPPAVVAEIGINHGGEIDVAIEMADAALGAGAKLIKHQTHVIDDEMSAEAKTVIPGNANISIFEIMRDCSLNEKNELMLMQHIQSRGGTFISAPFSLLALDRLRRFDVAAIKIGSGECNNYPFVKRVVELQKPVILSTGMNSIESIRPSVEIMRQAQVPFCLLHCTNVYPTPPELVRLNCIDILRSEFPDAVVGLSDHTVDNYACLGAVAFGAALLERHFTDSKERVGPDIICSMDPVDLKNLIEGSRTIAKAMGGNKLPVAEEQSTIAFAFASVVATRNIKVGEELSENNIFPQRPSGGDFSSADYSSLIGRTAKTDIKKGFQIQKADIDISFKE